MIRQTRCLTMEAPRHARGLAICVEGGVLGGPCYRVSYES